MKLELQTNKIAFHGGVGYFNEEILYSGGIKYYLDNLYVDAIYGSYCTIYDVYYSDYGSYETDKELIQELGLMIGYNLFLLGNLVLTLELEVDTI